MAKKIPSNFYQEVNVRKLDRVFSNEGDVPTPSVSDEGKVLKVNSEGKYALLPDGGAYTMTVAITYDETTEEYSADKTHTEIVEAIAAGVIVNATYDGRTFVYAGTNDPSAFDGVYFTYIQADSEDQLLCKCFEIDSDNRIVYSSHDISEELPVVDSSDNGKVLGVVGGVWDKMTSTSSPIITMTKRTGAHTFEFNDGYKLNDIKNLLLSGVFPTFIWEDGTTKKIYDIINYDTSNSPTLILQRFERTSSLSTLITKIAFSNATTNVGYYDEYTVNDPA